MIIKKKKQEIIKYQKTNEKNILYNCDNDKKLRFLHIKFID